MEPAPEALTITQIIKSGFAIDRSTLIRACQAGKIPGAMVYRGTWYITPAGLALWKAKHHMPQRVRGVAKSR